jgi:hypothetical protein
MSISTKPIEDLSTALTGTGGPKMLTLHDLCDSTASGVESALVRLARDGKVIDFCGHHFEEHELVLTLEGWVVTHDIRPNPEQRKRAAEPVPFAEFALPPVGLPTENPFAIPGSPVNAPVSDDTDAPDAGL